MIKKEDPEWRGTKEYLEGEIAKAHLQLERADLTDAQLHRTRGMIAAWRAFIEKIDPRTVVPATAGSRDYTPTR